MRPDFALSEIILDQRESFVNQIAFPDEIEISMAGKSPQDQIHGNIG